MSYSSAMKDLPDLTAVLDGLPAPAILLDTDYRILLANRAYRETYGDGHPLTRRRCYEVSHRYDRPCDLAGESCPLQASISSRQPSRVLHIHHTAAGQEYVDVETFPIADGEGRIRYLIETMKPSEIASQAGPAPALMGRSPAFRRMLGLVERVCGSDTTVMLLGESGTGKERVAQLIHQRSPRVGKAFVPVECTGLPETLFESELFGHEKGAFTGAAYRKQGLVEAAEGGTLFLDEIGDVPPEVQVKLLRLLETRTYRRVGNPEVHRADFRLVCATNKDLAGLVAAGRFREDLYYRLNVFDIVLPPLRERREDIALLVRDAIARLAPERRITVDPETGVLLGDYDFPGNVRELRNIVERALLLMDGERLLPQHLPPRCRDTGLEAPPPLEGETILPLAEMERRYLARVAARYPGERRELARLLGLSERALYRKLAALRDGGN